jgi:hypothetical protein
MRVRTEESAELDPALRVAGDEGSEPPDARTLQQQRIDRLDETLARISAMLPLLKGETKRDLESRRHLERPGYTPGPGAVAQLVRAADS